MGAEAFWAQKMAARLLRKATVGKHVLTLLDKVVSY